MFAIQNCSAAETLLCPGDPFEEEEEVEETTTVLREAVSVGQIPYPSYDITGPPPLPFPKCIHSFRVSWDVSTSYLNQLRGELYDLYRVS